MKIKSLAICALLMLSIPAFAKDTAVAVATNKIGDNLDLELVSAEFGAAKDLEDFEKRLNDPKSQVSNLDLNKDGQVDYLIVSERADGDVHYVDIDASIGEDKKQNVATIKVDSKSSSEPVQIVGETSIYGSNYVYVPTYVHPPVFFTLFWLAAYHPWHSPWHWGYYPPVFRPWAVRPFNSYRGGVDININKHNNILVRKDHNNNRINSKVDRNDNKLNIDRSNSDNKIGNKIDGKLNRNVAVKPGMENKIDRDKIDGKLDNHASRPNVGKAEIADKVDRAERPKAERPTVERKVAAKPAGRNKVDGAKANRRTSAAAKPGAVNKPRAAAKKVRAPSARGGHSPSRNR